MPAVESEKLVATLLEECQRLPERSEGYREVIQETVTDILTLERQHQRQATSIKQKITDKVDVAAQFLARDLR